MLSGEAAQGGHAEVVADRHQQHQAFGLAILRDQRHARAGPLGIDRPVEAGRHAVDADFPAHAAQHAEEGEQQLALALAVEPAEAHDLAPADREGDAAQLVPPGEVERTSRAGSGRGRLAGRGGNTLAMSRPIIMRITSALLRAPVGKVSIRRPLRNTEQVSARASISGMRCEM